jgi:hypothetical protein
MKKMGNLEKAAKLGMPFGTATGRLRKALLYDLAKKCGADVCFRCSEAIETLEEFSIEHKISWFNANDPAAAFFDLENVAFSHILCNIKAAARPWKRFENRTEQQRAVAERSRKDPERYRRILENKIAGYHRRKSKA